MGKSPSKLGLATSPWDLITFQRSTGDGARMVETRVGAVRSDMRDILRFRMYSPGVLTPRSVRMCQGFYGVTRTPICRTESQRFLPLAGTFGTAAKKKCYGGVVVAARRCRYVIAAPA